MKKNLSIILFLCLIFTLFSTGCSSGGAAQIDNNNPGAQNSTAAGAGDADTGPAQSGSNNPETQSGSATGSGNADKGTSQPEKNNNPATQINSATGSEDAEIDLTILGSTMLSAQLSNIRSNLSDYLGKTIKISGTYSSFYYEKTEKVYHNIITYMDQTMCCSEGMEFVWNGDHKYPDDYPDEGSAITIIGELGSYEELGIRYCYLAVDEIIVP